MTPILTWDQAAALADRVRKKGGTVVTTNGCFDLCHKGHVTYLDFARQQGDCLIVGINSDSSVKKIKGKERPLNNEIDRATVLAALRSVDAVCVFSEDTPVEWLRHIKPQVHVKGGDWDPEKLPEAPAVAEWGGRVMKGPLVEGFSTSAIIEKAKGNL